MRVKEAHNYTCAGNRQVVGVDFLGVSSATAILEVAKRGLPVPQVGGMGWWTGVCRL